MMPTQTEIEVPLLRVLEDLGGKGTPQEIYPRITKMFPALTEIDLAEQLKSGGNKWTNRIQWVRQKLIAAGDVESPERGVWAITTKGRKRLGAGKTFPASPNEEVPLMHPESLNLEELADNYETAFRQKLVQKLQDLSPAEFERFAGSLLSAYGFISVEVTGRSGDGGIDGHGKLKVGLATMNVAFQCKRWQETIGRPDIDKFRGAIQGEFEQGVFFVTSDFSAQAKQASIKKGAAPVVLLNGEGIASLMIEKEIGVRRRLIAIYEDQIDTLFETSADSRKLGKRNH